ncbi:cytochrome p450 [Coprinopsis cinerea AmutBmut pab1-1]|nr:cytochrome p450 [Coprinopsis cinerea AmutBmut pab1-1]
MVAALLPALFELRRKAGKVVNRQSAYFSEDLWTFFVEAFREPRCTYFKGITWIRMNVATSEVPMDPSKPIPLGSRKQVISVPKPHRRKEPLSCRTPGKGVDIHEGGGLRSRRRCIWLWSSTIGPGRHLSHDSLLYMTASRLSIFNAREEQGGKPLKLEITSALMP